MAKKSGNRTVWIILGGLIVLLVVMMALKGAGVVGTPKLMEVQETKTEAATIIETVTASGMVQPEVEISISPEVSGEIIELAIEEGDSVTEGDLLVRINPEISIQRVKQAEALLNQAKANAASSRANLARTRANWERQNLDYNRQQKLFEEKVTSQADWETAQANFKVAEQDLKAAEENANAAAFNVENAEASLQDARENLRRTTIFAPATGTVSKLNVEQGERVVGTSQMAGTEMMRIANLLAMEVRVNVNENDIIRVTVGDTATVDVDAYAPMDRQFKGIVTAIANTAKDRTSPDAVTEFEVKIRILNSSYEDLLAENHGQSPFRPGMTASVDIQTMRKANVLSAPLAAVTTRGKSEVERAQRGESGEEEGSRRGSRRGPDSEEEEVSFAREEEEELECVFVINEDNTVSLVVVTTGVKDFDNIEITSGLEAGQRVVSGPYLAVSRRLKDGTQVEVTNKERRSYSSDSSEEESEE